MHSSIVKVDKYFSILLMCLLLSSCSGAESTPTILFLDSTTSKPTVSLTITSTTTLVRTPRPSRTPLPPKPTKTIDAFAEKIAEFPLTCNDFEKFGISFSPDGNWLAVSCGYKRSQTLEIVNKNGLRWIQHFRDYLPKEFLSESGESDVMGNLYTAHWTSDERYLFFTPTIAFDGGGTCFYGFGVQGLYRIDLGDGSVSPVLPVSPVVFGYEIAFSPKGRWLAYQGIGDPIILDLKTGEETIIKVGENITGNFTWSPDGTELAYGTCQMYKEENDYGNEEYFVKKSAINIFSIQDQSSRIILEKEKDFLTIDGWNDDNIITIEDEDFQANFPATLYIDPSSGNLITATPTP